MAACRFGTPLLLFGISVIDWIVVSALSPKNGEFMILKFKYRAEDGILEPYREYTVARYSSMSDRVVIDFDGDSFDPTRYIFYLEFVSYDGRGIPRSRCVTPILEYNGGITYDLPASLTQYAGHVDMQLTGCDGTDSSKVFKSVSKYCKAFEVEDSAGVVENEIAQTPNIFTQIVKQLDEFGRQCESEIENIRAQLKDSLPALLDGKNIYTVEFVVYGNTVKKINVIEGSKLSEPQYSLPEKCSVVDGWYIIDGIDGRLWDFSTDRVEDNMRLTLNFMSDGLVFSQGKLIGAGNASGAIYVPEFYDGKAVTEIDGNIALNAFGLEFYMPSNMDISCFAALKNSKVKHIKFPAGGLFKISPDDGVYTDRDKVGVEACFFLPRVYISEVRVNGPAEYLGPYAISDNTYVTSISLPATMRYFIEGCICNTGVRSLKIPAAAESIEEYAIKDNTSLQAVYLEGDCSQGINENSFVDTTVTPHRRPTLYVRSEYYGKYAARNLPYVLKKIGEDN